MSYVIQNFNTPTRHIVFTPKLKSLVLLLNVEKIFFFFKINTHFFYCSVKNFTQINYFFIFHKYFYSRYLFLLFHKFNSPNTSFYDNNLHKSFRYHFFKTFLALLSNPYKVRTTHVFELQDDISFNQYHLSVKTINYKLPKSYYKNLFFFFMSAFSFLWYQHTSYFRFYLNFVLVNNVLTLSPFYNGYFLHVYNF